MAMLWLLCEVAVSACDLAKMLGGALALNMYLHSALVQTRRIDAGPRAKREAVRFNFTDALLSLNVAVLINSAILILASATFFSGGAEVTDLRQAHELLTPLLGTSAALLAFAIAPGGGAKRHHYGHFGWAGGDGGICATANESGEASVADTPACDCYSGDGIGPAR
ncbi:MAG: hypothetical protein HHJ18_03840 [Polaromonas sp.]|nr:hypothetical protein [Polaromonas sp.]